MDLFILWLVIVGVFIISLPLLIWWNADTSTRHLRGVERLDAYQSKANFGWFSLILGIILSGVVYVMM